MKTILTCVILTFGLTAGAFAQSMKARPVTAPVSKDIATFTQDVRLDGQSTSYLKSGPLTNSAEGFGLNKLSVTAPGVPFNPMPVMNISNPTTQSDALVEATRWVESDLGGFRTRYSQWMRSKGLSLGFYNYTQEIMVTTVDGVKKKAIAFNATIDVNGRPTYGNAKIVDPDPTILEAVYAPLKSAEGLPSSWKYPDAGHIRWRVLNRQFQPLTGWRLTNVNGVYDAPDSGNSEAGVSCLIDKRHPGCPTGQSDIRQIMDGSGAAFGLVSYLSKVEPVYEGGEEQTPKGAISYDSRTVDCTNLVNKGNFGFVLSLMANQYIVEPAANLYRYSLAQQFGGEGISPTEPFEKSVTLANLGGRHPDTVLISPYPEDDSVWSRTDTTLTKNVIHVAPIMNSSSEADITGADFAGDMAVNLISSAGRTKEYYIGTVGDNYWRTGSYDRTVTLNIENPQFTEQFSIIQTGFDDHMLVAVNGTIVYIGPYGGDMLEMNSGETEKSCAWNGGQWVCSSTTGPWVSAGTQNWWDRENGSITCPAGSAAAYGPNGYGCYQVVQRTYAHCDTGWWGGDSAETAYTCTQGCASWTVQHLRSGRGYGSGCLPLELRTSWSFNTNIDLRPYLKPGANQIFMRTLVGGGGEGWIRVRTRSCGVDGAETVPPGGSTGGNTGGGDVIRDRLMDQLLN